jgi:hypothetical protein
MSEDKVIFKTTDPNSVLAQGRDGCEVGFVKGANAAKPFEPKAKTSADPIAYVIWGDCTFQANNQGAAVKTWRTA